MTEIVISDAVPNGYKNPLTEDEVETIVSLKRDEGMTVEEIVARTGRSRPTVLRYLSRNGISFRTPRSKTPPLNRKQFTYVRQSKEYGMMSPEVAALMQVPLVEVNKIYGSPEYEYYVDHR